MEGIAEAQQLIVEVVDLLVQQRAHEGAESHHLALLRRPHPNADHRLLAVAAPLVESVQFFAMARGTDGENADFDRLDVQALQERLHQPARSQLGGDAVVALEPGSDLVHMWPDRAPGADRAGLIAAIK